MNAYDADFPVGTRVRIADKEALDSFKQQWKFHHPLQHEQLEFASRYGEVISVGYYHGGDVLYWLKDIPGVWHESCLRAIEEDTDDQVNIVRF